MRNGEKTGAGKDEGHTKDVLACRLRLQESGLFSFSRRRSRSAMIAQYKQLLV